jgi:hypothetical protein
LQSRKWDSETANTELTQWAIRNETNTTSDKNDARRRWLTPAILATQEAKIRRPWFQANPGQKAQEIQKGLVEWLKV